jgi:Short C-terminal domain
LDAFVARGRNGQLTVTPTKITISRKGVSGFMLHGHKGEKEIDLHQISAVQFKKNGLATAGYIQFSFSGGSETKQGIRDATTDENSILFKKSQEADFIRAKELLDEYRATLRTPVPAPASTASASVADELEKLATLRDKGVLDDEEFAAQKRKLLGL